MNRCFLGHALGTVLLSVLPMSASVHGAPLQLDEVLRRSRGATPQIAEALAKVRGTEGKALTARGRFDTVFDVEAQSRLSGYYDGTIVETRVTRPMTSNGGSVYAGYRVSRGDFPIYDDRSYTNRLGEVKIGAIFSLLRDRAIDDRRAGVGIADAEILATRLDQEMIVIGVQRRAISAYQAWVLAGRRLAAYRALLDVAEQRRGGVDRQVALGARPAILRTEVQQALVRRRALVVGAEQDLRVAANALSFYYRDAQGHPVSPTDDRLPDAFPELPTRYVPTRQAELIGRPDLDAITLRISQVDTRLQQARNEMHPRLDARAELARDLGDVGAGGPSRRGTDAIIGFRFTVPLQRRAAQGRIAEALADQDGLSARRKTLEDQILVEIKGIQIAVDGLRRQLDLAREEAELAGTMAAAERRRFTLGSSDLFVTNLREESAADARTRLIDAEYKLAAAQADLAAVSVDRRTLGLE